MKPLRRTFTVAVVLLLIVSWTAALSAEQRTAADELVVNDTLDDVDARPGNGVCASVSNRCTLRAAIQEANVLTGRQTVVIPPGLYRLTRDGAVENVGAFGDLDVTADIDLRGEDASTTIIASVAVDRVLDLGPRNQTLTATISGVTLRGGTPPLGFGAEQPDGGGGVRVGTSSQVSIYDSLITENGVESLGGGVLNLGQTRLIRAAVTFNVAGSGGGGIVTHGGSSRLVLHETLIDGNAAGGGGGIVITGPVDDLPRRAGVLIRNSTISHNRCNGAGGGILADRGTLSIESSTISGNVCGAAAGIFNDGGTVVTLRFSTITGNRAAQGGGMQDVHGAGADRFRLDHSILAGNFASFRGPDCVGPLVSLGGSLLGNDSDCFAELGPDDQVNVVPRLGPLERFSPLIFGHRPLRDSPALDTTGDTCPLRDQRGHPRPLDGDGDGVARCDIGAIEADAAPRLVFLPLMFR